MTDADITVSAVKNTFANSTNIRSNINLLDAELDAVNTRANNISISSVAGLQAALDATANASIIGNLENLAAGFPQKNTIVTIVDALNALNDSVSSIVNEHIAGGGFVKKNGDTMTGGLKILNASLMVGDVSALDADDASNLGKIVATGDIEAFQGGRL
jgi:hypothetical protein